MGLAVKEPVDDRIEGGDGGNWSGREAALSLARFAEKGLIAPVRTLLLSADLSDEARELAARGARLVVVDTRSDRLKALAATARREGFSVATLVADFLAMAPALAGPVELLVDRTFVHSLPPERRSGWICKAGRVLPMGGLLVGHFRIAREGAGPPAPFAVDELKKLTSRFFTTEVLEPWGPADPGRPRAYRGLFRRK